MATIRCLDDDDDRDHEGQLPEKRFIDDEDSDNDEYLPEQFSMMIMTMTMEDGC